MNRISENVDTDALIIIDAQVVNIKSLEMIRGQQAMVWIRDLEKMGWGSIEAGQDGMMLFKNKGMTITFLKNSDTVLLNSLAVRLPISTYMRDTRLMVPLSFVAKSMGYKYIAAYKTVASITSSYEPTKSDLGNWLQGRVLFEDSGVSGVFVKLFKNNIPISACVTDIDGGFVFKNLSDGKSLPDGTYSVKISESDNSKYNESASEPITIKGSQAAKFKEISITKK